MKKIYKAAIIIMPPEDQWEQIQSIRKLHDKAFVRWMPHINLIYPFVSDEYYKNNNLKEKLTQSLTSISPFDIELCDFDQFEHSTKNSTLFVHSLLNKDLICKVQNELVNVIPECNDLNIRSSDNLFHPHLTLGQFKGKSVTNNKIRSLKTSWKPIRWTNDRLYVIRRTDTTPFEIIDEILLGTETTSTKVQVDVDELLENLSLNPSNEYTSPVDSSKLLIKRITEWIKRMINQNKGLPKTKEKLGRTISKMCYVQSSVDWNKILNLNKEKGYIKLKNHFYTINLKQLSDINKDDYNSFNENKNLPKCSSGGYYMSSYGEENLSLTLPSLEEQEKIAFDRCILWLKNSTDKHPEVAFNSQFKQLCNFKVYISNSKVLEYLQKLGIYTLEDDYESITYHL